MPSTPVENSGQRSSLPGAMAGWTWRRPKVIPPACHGIDVPFADFPEIAGNSGSPGLSAENVGSPPPDHDGGDWMTTAGEAQDRLLAAAQPLVVRYCRARLGTGLVGGRSADDVAQDVCVAVFKALTTRPPDRPFPNFVCGIAKHKVAAARKDAARQWAEPVAEVPDEADFSMDPEDHALRVELSERMAKLLQVLPEKQREIVVLRVAVGLTAEETAAAVGSTPGAVRVAQHRALSQLRKVVAG